MAEPPRNKVLNSVENPFGDFCVDIFVRPDGTFGFDEYRRDPEDNGRWQCLHRFGGLVFDSTEAALAHAKSAVPWLANGA
jgi:hypothetical protein